jgi:adenylate cyclase
MAPDTAPGADRAAAKRKLATILSADVKAFSRLMEADEEATLRILQTYRAAIDALISSHDGRVVGTAGDSVLAEFMSPVQAARCAAEIQDELARRNATLSLDRRLEFRIGINLGDVIVEGADLFGNGVNVAARLQALADPGGIFISGGIYDQIKTNVAFDYEFLGSQTVKNIAEPVRVYRVHRDPAAALASRRARQRRRWALNAAVAALILAGSLGIWYGIPLLAPAIERFAGEPATPVTDQASIAILPFANQSGREDAYFSDGLTEDLISALGRFSGLSVMSWNAVAPYRNQVMRPEQLAQDLGVRYVVDGSVRRADDRLRVTTGLTDGERGTLLWSERYDRAVDDVFAVQDDITRQIVSALALQVTNLEQDRAASKPTDNLTAYDYYLRARQQFRQFTRRGNLQARELLGKAIDLDHEYSDAYAALAWTHTKAAEMGWAEWPDRELAHAHDLAQAALRIDPANQLAHILLALVYSYQQNYELALDHLDRATAANPHNAGNHAERGWVLLVGGRSGEAVTALEEALRFDPSPTPNTFSNLAIAYYLQGRHDDAVTTAQSAVGRYPHHISLWIVLAAAYAEAGQLDAAARAAEELRRRHPFFEVESFGNYFRDPAERERFRESLRKAGL